MNAQHTPGPLRESMLALKALGFSVRDVWLGDYFDGISATKKVGGRTVEIYSGNADDGAHTDLHFAPVVYVDDRAVARDIASVEKAARIADFRVSMLRATGATS